MILHNYRITRSDRSLIAYIDMSCSKLFLMDVGPLGAKTDIHAKALLDSYRIFKGFKDALTEQLAAQQINAAGKGLYFYSAKILPEKLTLLFSPRCNVSLLKSLYTNSI